MASKHDPMFILQMSVRMYDDGAYSATGDGVKGLNLEADTFRELVSELRRIAPELLEFNHKMTSDEVSRTVVRLVVDVPLGGTNHEKIT